MRKNFCPTCKRYVGLWKRNEPQPFACELHHHKIEKVKWTTYITSRNIFYVKEK